MDTVSIPAGQPQGCSSHRLGRAAIFGFKEDDDFEHNPRASWPGREGWDGCEEPASEHQTRVKNVVAWRIGDLAG